MGSYENIVKLEEMRKRTDEGEYLTAQKILDTMDLKKIKNSTDMSLIAEIFSQNGRYEEALDMLLKIYQKTKTRRIVYQLVEVCIKDNNAAQAEKYFSEYEKIAPMDFYKHIFRYKIDKIKQESFPKLIESLETLKKTEYIEQWAYELAKLYYKAGMEEECIRECSDIILWFGDGVYVEKAKMLKAYYSGETDKVRMIEELKRRAAKDKTEDQSETNSPNTQEYIINQDSTEESDFEINEIPSENDTAEDLADDLKKDVENILSEETSEEF